MELRITKFDAALHRALKMQAAKQGKSLRLLVIELLLQAAMKINK
jgi:predicted HicB family RNase H-like nuclease